MTWKLYIEISLGKIACPQCHTKLNTKHPWFYLPLVIVGCCLLGVPLAYIGGSIFGPMGILAGWIIGAIGIGVPFDKFLETTFSVLKIN